MQRYLFISFLCLFINGCANLSETSFFQVYKMDIQQGNLITDTMIDTLRPGMTRRQVHYIMGTPLLKDTFNNDRWDYVYEKRGPEGLLEHKKISVYFSNERMTYFE